MFRPIQRPLLGSTIASQEFNSYLAIVEPDNGLCIGRNMLFC